MLPAYIEVGEAKLSMNKASPEAEPGSGQLGLNVHALAKADLLVPPLHPAQPPRSGTLSRFCHAGMYVGNYRVLQVDDSGLREVHIKDFVPLRGALVMRREPLEWTQGQQVAQCAFSDEATPSAVAPPRSSAGPYWLLGVSSPLLLVAAASKDIKGMLQDERAFYCPSRFVMAFQRANVPIIGKDRPVGASPASIVKMRNLALAGWLEP